VQKNRSALGSVFESKIDPKPHFKSSSRLIIDPAMVSSASRLNRPGLIKIILKLLISLPEKNLYNSLGLQR